MSSSLSEDLKSIQLKPFHPIYSAKTEPILKRRYHQQEKPKTPAITKNTSIETSRTNSCSTPHNAFSSSSKNNFSTSSATSRLSEISSKSEKTSKNSEEQSISGSTNLSLLSLESNDSLPLFKTYGQFNYFSYFEKYMNIKTKFKIPRNLMPEQPTENEVSQMDKDDLFSPFELLCLDRLYDVYRARPFRLRSKSVSSSNSIDLHERYLQTKENNMTKLASVECVDPDYIDYKFEITKKFERAHAKVELSDDEYRKNLLATFETEYDTIFPNFYARDIKYPSIYEWGYSSKKRKKAVNKDDVTQNQTLASAQRYSNVESRLAPYIRRKQHVFTDHLYERRSKTALNLHKFTSSKYNIYSKSVVEKPQEAGLKMSSHLENLIREEIRKNNGPIYFYEFTRENVEDFSSNFEVKLSNKYFYIYEWLSKIKVEECSHFYKNPFTTDNAVNTDISNFNPEPVYNFFPDENIKMNVLQKQDGRLTKKFTVDPTRNIKLDETNKNQLPKKKLRSHMGKEQVIETLDKKILAVNKDYKTNFKLKTDSNSEKVNKNKDRYITSRERLKKQLALNDLLMTRLTLDIFCL